MANGYTKPVNHNVSPQFVQEDLYQARETLIAKRKLTLIMRTQATVDIVLKTGDLVQVFVKNEQDKRRKWLSKRAVISTNTSEGTIYVPGDKGHEIIIAVEDTRPFIVSDDLA